MRIKRFLHGLGSFRKRTAAKIKRFFYVITFKKIRRLTSVVLVDSLRDISQYNWEQLNIHNEPKWMFKDQLDIEMNRGCDGDLLDSKYCQLHDESAVLSGSFFTLEKIMILMVQRIEARALVALGDRKQRNFVRLYTSMIDELLKGGDDVDIVKQRLMIQKAYGLQIDPKNTTAFEFLQIRNLLQEQNATVKK